MGMDKDQLRDLIKDTLIDLGFYSESALNLLMGTAAQESRLGEFIKQLGGGPALSIFQIEPATHNDHVSSYLGRKQDVRQRIKRICNIEDFNAETLKFNLKYAICIARIHYLRRPESLPRADDIEGMARYWKRFYNTYLGAGTEQEFIDNYKKYVL